MSKLLIIFKIRVMKKVSSFLFFLSFSAISLFAQSSGSIQSTLDNIRTTYVRPALVGLILIVILVGGVANMGKIREGGEAGKQAMMSVGMLALWPILLFAIVEILGSILK